MNLDEFKISGNKKFDFKNFDPGAKKLKVDKFEIANKCLVNLQRLGQFQDKFYAEGKESLLLIFQAMDAGGKDKKISVVTENTYNGTYAALLQGATYLYQDIPVEGGKCYQLKMHVSAPNPEVKWRYWCSWMEGSTALSGFSDPIRSSSYQYQTEGYIDAMEGMIVRAPANATRIRMEIRTYSGTPITGEGLFGLYVDEISVERVR